MMQRDISKGRLFSAALLFAFFLCASGFVQGANAEPAAPLALVGQSAIDETAVKQRIGIGRAYGNDLSESAALVALINDAIDAEVAAAVGVSPTPEEINAFAKGVDKNSKAPEVLKAVKQVFGDDVAAYQRLFLAPKMVNRKLRNWFSRDAGMQQKPRAAIQRAYGLAAAGNDFEKVAKATGLKFAAQDYKAEQKESPDALRAYFPEGMATMTPGFRNILDGLKAGEMAQSISEDDSVYRLVRLLEVSGEKDAKSYKTVEIIAPKEPFDPWYREQVKKVPVRIKDDELRKAIAVQYPRLEWIKAE